MAKYTTELRAICEGYAHVQEPISYDQIPTIIEAGRQGIFDFTYPIWDPTYKQTLETKIIKHYFTREIGAESYGLWKLRLDSTLNEIMPFYNRMYESTVLQFNPLYDVDYTTSHEGSGDSSRTGSEQSSGTAGNTRTNNLTHAKTGTETNLRTDDLTDTRTGTEVLDETVAVDTSLEYDGKEINGRVASRKEHDESTSKTLSGTSSNTGTHLENDTPQGGLPADYENSTMYLTKWNKDTGSGTTGGTETSTVGSTDTETFQDEKIFDDRIDITDSDTDRDATTTYDLTEGHTGTQTTQLTHNVTDADTGTVSDSGTHSETRSNSESISSTDEYVEHVVGHMSGSYAKAILEFRETLINIDQMIIDELNNLFMLLW